MKQNSSKTKGFSTQGALETGMAWGVSTVEVVSAVILFVSLLIGSVAIQVVDVLTGAMGWSRIMANVPSLPFLGWQVPPGFMALMIEAGPDAISSLLIGIAAAKIRRNRSFSVTGPLVFAIAFGLIVHVGDAVKDYMFALEFVEPAVALTISVTRQNLMAQIGAVLIGFISLAGNAALPGLLAFARMTLNRYEEQHEEATPVHGAGPTGQHMPPGGGQPGFRPPVQATPPADAPAGEHDAPQGGFRPPMPGGTGRLPGVPQGQPVQNRPSGQRGGR